MSNSASTPILINGGNSFYNLYSTLGGITDYTLMAQNYLFARLESTEFELVRAVDEATMAANTGG